MSGIMLNFAGVSAASVPGAPTIGTATTTGATTATVSFTAPASNGGSVITSYTATSSPAGGTGTLSQAGSGTISVTGLTPNTAYTFTVVATNAIGNSPSSAASNSITTDPVFLLFTWGKNNYGQLGQGNTTNRSSPIQVGSTTTWRNVTAGEAMGMASTSGSSYNNFVWGQNNFGQLGVGDTNNRSSPVTAGSANASAGGGSQNQTFRISQGADTYLFSTGRNQFGQLGLGDITYRSSFTFVGSGFSQLPLVLRGDTHTACVKSNGTLFTWGSGGAGSLGLGNTTNYSSPKQVGALTNWAKPAVGESFTLCIKTDGTLWSWGFNNYGQLGNGNTTNRSSPVQVGSLTDWAEVVAGPFCVICTKTDGTLWAWGRNLFGSLPLGNSTSYSSPKQVGSLTNWSKPTTIGFGGGCVKTDGTLWIWGNNNYGQLGNGNTAPYSSPIQVGALTSWTKIAGGQNFTLAIRN